jgi:hypothetical protein
MLSRDFIAGFITSQIQQGFSQEESISNFQAWMNTQTEAVISPVEKLAISKDLSSYINIKVEHI